MTAHRRRALVATLLAGLLHRADRVLLLGEGTGRLQPALARAGLSQIEVASWRTETWPLLARLGGDGPVADPTPLGHADGPSRSATQPATWSIPTRTCVMASRSRIVTVRSVSVSWSIVMHHGVPTSSCRR